MATDNRTYPNRYFAWYNDDNRLAVVCQDDSSSGSERTTEKYDTFQGTSVTNGIRMHYHAIYETVTASTEDLYTNIGVALGLQEHIVDYVKCRLYENQGNFQEAQYHMQKYEVGINKWPSRKSGVRSLSVPRL